MHAETSEPPPEPPARRLTLADLMLLVAAAAIGIALNRALSASVGGQFDQALPLGWRICSRAGAVLQSLALAVLIAGRIHPREGWRAWSIRPGTAACLWPMGFNVLHLAMALPRWLIGLARGSSPPYFSAFDNALFALGSGGASVAVAWGVLATANLWRPAPTWTDRTGRAIGASLILGYLVLCLGL